MCPRGDGFVLVPTAVTIELVSAPPDSINEGGSDWIVRAPACPGDDVVLLEGRAVTGAQRAHADSGAGDGAASSADGGGDDASVAVPVTTVAKKSNALLDAAGVTLTLGDRTLHLWVPPASSNEEAEEEALVLDVDGVSEVLIDDGNTYSVRWAGDLDGDGRLDLLIDHSPEFQTFDLFLSSHTGGRLMRRAAQLARMGD
jgi:hypothetical protein